MLKEEAEQIYPNRYGDKKDFERCGNGNGRKPKGHLCLDQYTKKSYHNVIASPLVDIETMNE